MRLNYIKTGCVMTVRELMRNRVALILLFGIPTLFYALVALTTTDRRIIFILASILEGTIVEVSERSESLIFIGLAAIGLLASFLALNLVQKHAHVNRRLVLCGYRSSELITSKLAVLLCAIILIGCYIATILFFFFQPKHLILVVIGFIAGGYIYGCYGLLVGTIFKRELEGILFIVLLVNIDAGWLQNPIYYAEAQNKAIIRHLPAYFPSQVSMISAFTDNSIITPLIESLVYGSILLFATLIIFWWKMRLQR
jgi:hypothetical protein